MNFERELLGAYTIKIFISWKTDCVKSFLILGNIPYCEIHIVWNNMATLALWLMFAQYVFSIC